MKFFHFSGVSSSAKIASTGHAGTQAPQSIHSSGWMNSCSAASNSGSSFRGWMQSTGQTSTQAVSFVPMQGSVMVYVTRLSCRGAALGVLAPSYPERGTEWHPVSARKYNSEVHAFEAHGRCGGDAVVRNGGGKCSAASGGRVAGRTRISPPVCAVRHPRGRLSHFCNGAAHSD